MTATKQDVKRWIDSGKDAGATHLISVCDTFDHDDYPVYVMPGEDLNEIKSRYDGKDMQRINEVIELQSEKVTEESQEERKNKVIEMINNDKKKVENWWNNLTLTGKKYARNLYNIHKK